MELLAPAGSAAALAAALENGAEAAYLGAGGLSARRGAENPSLEELPARVNLARRAGARLHLALNIDLAPRELGLAARWLDAAARAGAAAVIVRDPGAVWLWRALRDAWGRAESPAPDGADPPAWPRLHFSTQTAVACSADLRAARLAGASRAVLAREMTLDEIRRAVRTGQAVGMEAEVFAHGAMCFSVSGRCGLSSWGGGRGGNRGACVSPCRAPWRRSGAAPGGVSGAAPDLSTPFSMRDLALVERLADLRDAGVAALKIEGRLKSPEWVGAAVRLYREALDSSGAADPAGRPRRAAEVERLSRYAGRASGVGCLDGDFTALTGSAARPPAPRPPAGMAAMAAKPSPVGRVAEVVLTVRAERGVEAVCRQGERVDRLTLPRTVVKRARGAARLGDWLDARQALAAGEGVTLAVRVDDPDFPMPAKNVNALEKWLAGALRKRPKRAAAAHPLPEAVAEACRCGQSHPENARPLTARPDRVRLSPEQTLSGLEWLPGDSSVTVVVDGLLDAPDRAAWDEPAARRTADALGRRRKVWALPGVMFEADLPAAVRLAAWAAAAGDRVEINTWGGWTVCADAGAGFEIGPGLGVLNRLAARFWMESGAWAAGASAEIDHEKFSELAGSSPARLIAWVYGRPVLMASRADAAGGTWEDRRGIRLSARRARGLVEFHPLAAYDWRRAPGAGDIRVGSVGLDLRFAPDPAAVWRGDGEASPFLFNWTRGLF